MAIIRNLIIIGGMSLALSAQAQMSRLGENVEYKVEASETGATGDMAPLWLTANKYGLSSTENNSGYLRGAIERRIETDSAHNWKFGYGADFVVPYNYTSKWIVQQLYAEVQLMKFRVSLGSKERSQDFKNDALSMGGMTFSNNARPIPQLRGELADWWNISGRSHMVAFKGHMSYGMQTDGDWQERFVGKDQTVNMYAKNVMYHSKAGYFRIGNEKRFPLTGMFGLQMVAQYGGEVWNLTDRAGSGNENFDRHQKFGRGLRQMWEAFIPGGSDVNDGAYANVAGNQLGSWVFSLDWNTPDWGVHAYMDHFFEDHSMMFFQYGWKDNLIGLEARLPKNRIVSNLVYEYLNTRDQSGAVYHDGTNELPINVYGKDSYYNHHIYGSYQHWGQAQGNALLISPIYNKNHSLWFYHNRTQAHHIGLSGQPHPDVAWRLLLTHQRTFGTHDVFIEDNKATHILAEATYTPHQLRGWKFCMGFASTSGSLMGSTQGLQATITKQGIIKKRKK